jgi:hypothetical protein
MVIPKKELVCDKKNMLIFIITYIISIVLKSYINILNSIII